MSGTLVIKQNYTLTDDDLTYSQIDIDGGVTTLAESLDFSGGVSVEYATLNLSGYNLTVHSFLQNNGATLLGGDDLTVTGPASFPSIGFGGPALGYEVGPGVTDLHGVTNFGWYILVE